MTEEEAKGILRKVKQQDGTRFWRRHILITWVHGDYRTYGFVELAPELQQIRNAFGPTWLTRVKGI